ncbi:autotransporter outer membrane beta-barrel domain-containing protein [Escherichia coli]
MTYKVNPINQSDFTASLEAGYKHKLAEFNGSQGTRNEWYVQPQAQVTLDGSQSR